MAVECIAVDKIDVYNPDNYVDAVPFADFALLRQVDPVHWHPHPDGGGYWLLTRHADCQRVSRDHQTFSARRGFVLVDDLSADILPMAQGQLLGMDPPEHGPIRRVVIDRFTQKTLVEWEIRIRAMCKEIFDDLGARTECDFVNDIAAKLPTRVIAEMMGVPREMWDQFRHWADKQTSASDPDLGGTPEEVNAASIAMGSYGFELACQRKGGTGDDLISLLLNVEVDGNKVDEMQFASLFVQIAVAGNETTRTLIASGMHELMLRPPQLDAVKNDPALIPAAVEEMLRYVCPLHYFRRTATKDTEIGGKQIRENDRVVMLYSAANRDPAVFANPDQFDIRRRDNPHLAFGYGIHLCLGANLARLEARVLLEEFFKRYTGIEETAIPRRIRSNLINGFKSMPVRLIPRKA